MNASSHEILELVGAENLPCTKEPVQSFHHTLTFVLKDSKTHGILSQILKTVAAWWLSW